MNTQNSTVSNFHSILPLSISAARNTRRCDCGYR